jgi:lipoprotein-releasing system permease protein
MVIAMALMTGYQEDLERKLSSGNAAVLALPVGIQGENPSAEEAQALLAALPDVVRVTPVVLGQGVLGSAAERAGTEVTVRGVDPGAGAFTASAEALAKDGEGIPGVVLGAELASQLRVEEGEVMRLVALTFERGRARFRYQSLRFAGTFNTGFSEFDSAWMLVDRGVAARLYGHSAGATMFEVEPRELRLARQVAAAAEEALGPGYLVTNWLDLNQDLFAALRLQKWMLFLVLGLIVLVSTFNVASTLVISVRDRMREIGVLGALGLDRPRLRRLFLLYGGFLGSLGVAGGVAVGWLVSWTLDTFELIRFDAEVAAIYFINAVRFHVRGVDVLAIVAFALAVNLLACALPAWAAARVEPSRALRYE